MQHDADALTALLPYASPGQARYIETIIATGSMRAASKELDINRRTITRALTAVRKKAALMGWSPSHDMKHPVPDGYKVGGVSTLYGGDGMIKAQWVKSRADDDRREQIMREAFEAFAGDLPRCLPSTSATLSNSDLATAYILTDYHLGMLAWGEETGADWDIKIAEDLLIGWFGEAIRATPPSEVGVLVQLGDFLHMDNLEALTPASKHVLDADSRIQKVVRVAIRSVRKSINMMLEKHAKVHVVMAEGNHDPVGSIWLREWLHVHYENEPRITVDLRADGYYCYEHGKTSLFMHHGHKRKPENIDATFVAKFREVFGRTKHSYGLMGHLHHARMIESALMLIEQFRTISAPDAYAARGGFMSGRSASAITYHREHGEVGRITITPDMIQLI
jgi:hypothetical protein